MIIDLGFLFYSLLFIIFSLFIQQKIYIKANNAFIEDFKTLEQSLF